MSIEEIKRFTKDLKEKTELQDAIKAAGTSPEAVVKVAEANGYDFTVEELNTAAKENKGELSEEQLDQVAGGTGVVVNAVGTTIVVEVTVVAT